MWPTLLAVSYLKEILRISLYAMEFFHSNDNHEYSIQEVTHTWCLPGHPFLTTLHMPTIGRRRITPAILSTLISTHAPSAQPTLSTFLASSYNSPICPFFFLLTLLRGFTANSQLSFLPPLLWNNQWAEAKKSPNVHFSLFTTLPYPFRYKPRVSRHSTPWAFSKQINNITRNILKKQITTFLHRQLQLYFYYLLPISNTIYLVIPHTYSTIMIITFSFPFPLSLCPYPDRFFCRVTYYFSLSFQPVSLGFFQPIFWSFLNAVD